MLHIFKRKGKTPSLWIHARSVDSQLNTQASETISITNMPLVSHTALTVVLPDSRPNLHTTQVATLSGSAPQVRKSLNFDNATAPPIDTAITAPEQIIVHDTAVQTAMEQKTPAQGSATGTTGPSLQTR